VDAFLGPPAASKESAKGWLRAWIPAPGVLVTEAEGHIDADLVAVMIETGNEVVRQHGRLVGFHRWWGVTTYEPEARVRLTEWGYRIRRDVERVHFLVSSKLVRMGIAVASIVLVGMLVPHDDADEFEGKLRETIAARRRATLGLTR
jgi:hypothetical protein